MGQPFQSVIQSEASLAQNPAIGQLSGPTDPVSMAGFDNKLAALQMQQYFTYLGKEFRQRRSPKEP